MIDLLTEDFLESCLRQLKRDKAVGVDGVTVREYEANLTKNLKGLIARMKAWKYRPKPVTLSLLYYNVILIIYFPEGSQIMVNVTWFATTILKSSERKIGTMHLSKSFLSMFAGVISPSVLRVSSLFSGLTTLTKQRFSEINTVHLIA